MISNPKEIQPYYDNVFDWVNNLDYMNWSGGDPFLSQYGNSPYNVYKNLFEEPHYYGLTPEELSMLRSSIQYKVLYLNDYFNKEIKLLEDCGFEVYRKGKFDFMKYVYLKRNNISLFVSNIYTPQDYVPNTMNMEICEYVTSKKTGKKRRKQLESFARIPLFDDFGEKTKESFEKYLNNIVR